ncbi:MAG: sugar phosphate isomerase/epimerase [Angelakisella sp.]
MKLGISTACYYPMKTEEALALVVEGGAACTEVFFNSFSELSPEYLRNLKAILQGGQTSVASVHPFTCGLEPMLFFGNYSRRFEDGLEFYKQYFQAAAELGAAYCVLHGALGKHGITAEQYLDSYGRLHREAQAFGVKIAQENVGRCMSRDPQLFRLLRKAIPDAAFVLDIKQTFRSDSNVEGFLEAMGENIVHLHMSDATESNDCLPIGKGSVNFHSLFERLKKNGYGGDAVLELYAESYNNEKELWSSLKKLEKMVKS